MNKTIGLFAHVDAGKTTFAEQLLFHTNRIRSRGRVDHRNAFLDSHDIEKERGITVFADQAVISFEGSTYFLIDTPGHIDFSSEMERAIMVLDYAIVIVSAVEGVQGHTETVWQLLRKHHIPTFFFLNKIDRVGADVARVLEDIRIHLTKDVCHITESLDVGWMSDDLITWLAERDEQLFQLYMDDTFDYSVLLQAMIQMVKQSEIFPCIHGSALQDIGIIDFLQKLELLSVTHYSMGEEDEFSGRVYKIRYDENGTRITYIKALQGTLRVRDELQYGIAEYKIREKVTQIRQYNGTKYMNLDHATAGQLFAVAGLSMAAVGDGVGELEERVECDIVPTLQSKVIFEPSLHPKDVLKCFQILDAEDPSLHVTWDEQMQEIHIHLMGTIQLEVLERIVNDRFGIKVGFGTPEILYKETIVCAVEGCGHFEPLRHYAEVHLKLDPTDRNTGIRFESNCHPDDLATNYQNLVQQHLFEQPHHGILTGSPLTDVKITLLNGRAHVKHTSGGDFREAAYRALRQALEKASNVLLEPYYDVKIKIDFDQVGRVVSDLQQAHGQLISQETIGNKAVIVAKAPVATFLNYSSELASFTQGKGILQLGFGGYERCHNVEEVIARIGYNKNADPAYTSSTIFCSKGQAYTVLWDEAEAKMNC